MDGYRTATHLDYACIVRLLTDGDTEGVLVRSLLRSDIEPYPLLEISKGPFGVTSEGITGYSPKGVPCTIRIADNSLQNVELKFVGNQWIAPEMGSVILLIVH
jgi:hypothetical protein